jgi:hypothetical protein
MITASSIRKEALAAFGVEKDPQVIMLTMIPILGYGCGRPASPPAYMNEQMGHHSMQVAVDTYAHLIPGADVSCVDTLDSTPQNSANAGFRRKRMSSQVIDLIGGPGGIRTPDQGIMSPSKAADNKENQQDRAVDCGKSRQNPHTGRTQK